jgi:hypothetical protein
VYSAVAQVLCVTVTHGVYTTMQHVPITIFAHNLVQILVYQAQLDLKWATQDVTVQVLTVHGQEMLRLLVKLWEFQQLNPGVHVAVM